MGADLYIEPSFENAMKPVRERHGEQFWQTDAGRAARNEVERELYFRDSYNSTSVLWTLGLSWWTDVAALLDDNGDLAGELLKRFRTMVAECGQRLPSADELREKYATVDDGENSVDSWHDYYRNKRIALLAFLDRAIARGERVHCSI